VPASVWWCVCVCTDSIDCVKWSGVV
jgi:hypothetical protein